MMTTIMAEMFATFQPPTDLTPQTAVRACRGQERLRAPAIVHCLTLLAQNVMRCYMGIIIRMQAAMLLRVCMCPRHLPLQSMGTHPLSARSACTHV